MICLAFFVNLKLEIFLIFFVNSVYILNLSWADLDMSWAAVRYINIGQLHNNWSGTHKFGQVHTNLVSYTNIFQAHKNCPNFKISKF